MSREPVGIPNQIDPPDAAQQLVRSAMQNHWSPATVDIEADRGAVRDLDPREFLSLRALLAQFGVSEQAVTEDLAPLAVVLEDPDDQRFVATQLYDEARHAELFHRYWEEIVRPEERARGLTPTDPDDERWQTSPHRELLDRTDRAMTRLLKRDAPATRALAYCHYHLVVEGILAHTAYDWIETWYSDGSTHGPELPGLAEGFRGLRQDEARHVGFGVRNVRRLLDGGEVNPSTVTETIDELLPFVQDVVGRMIRADDSDATRKEMLERVENARDRRVEQVVPDDTDA